MRVRVWVRARLGLGAGYARALPPNARRWDTLLDGAEYRAHFGSGPLFVSSEIFMGRTARRFGVGLGSTLTLTLTRA